MIDVFINPFNESSDREIKRTKDGMVNRPLFAGQPEARRLGYGMKQLSSFTPSPVSRPLWTEGMISSSVFRVICQGQERL
jgi:hypothetical protein